MIHHPGDHPKTSLHWYTTRLEPSVQAAARKRFVRQAEQALWRLAESNRLDALVAIQIVKRAFRAEETDNDAPRHKCGEACEWATDG